MANSVAIPIEIRVRGEGLLNMAKAALIARFTTVAPYILCLGFFALGAASTLIGLHYRNQDQFYSIAPGHSLEVEAFGEVWVMRRKSEVER